jgi:hypothetical protein
MSYKDRNSTLTIKWNKPLVLLCGNWLLHIWEVCEALHVTQKGHTILCMYRCVWRELFLLNDLL